MRVWWILLAMGMQLLNGCSTPIEPEPLDVVVDHVAHWDMSCHGYLENQTWDCWLVVLRWNGTVPTVAPAFGPSAWHATDAQGNNLSASPEGYYEAWSDDRLDVRISAPESVRPAWLHYAQGRPFNLSLDLRGHLPPPSHE